MVYLRDIAAILGVSVSTVGKALKGYPDISEETRRRVIRTAEDIGYRADGDRDRRVHDWSCQEPGPVWNQTAARKFYVLWQRKRSCMAGIL